MRVTATAGADEVVRRVAESGREDLVVVLANGCCDSTAPFLYDHYVLWPDAERVGSVGGVPVYAQAWLARLYPDGELTMDVDRGVVSDGFSLESLYDCRLTLRLAPTPA